jgi:Zn-dependent peptidase ImmA (M78 family)
LNLTRKSLAREAIEKSVEVREEYGYDFRSPLCVYELCERAGVKVSFVDDVSMEGVYAALGKPTIVLSALRPLARRAFTCAHELGHHVFGHGSTIDELREEADMRAFDPKEFLVDAFAGSLLMPVLGVKRAFAQRALDLNSAMPEQVYTVACSFGVGYETLIGHLAYGLQLLPAARAEELGKVRLPKIRERLTGAATKEHLVIADAFHASKTLDAEAGMLVMLPAGTTSESDRLEFVADLKGGRLFRALRPGLARTFVPGTEWAVVVRVSKPQYAGLAKYRHLEESNDDE